MQKAVQDNRTTQHRHMKASGHLIKTQDDVTDGGTMANIAAEVAAEAAARSENIRQEMQKLTMKIDSPQTRPREDKVTLNRHAVQELEHKADVQDIRMRSIHQLDISDRLPWLKGLDDSENQPRMDKVHEEDTQSRERERLTSPDSGVIDHLSEATTESLDGHTPSHSMSSPPLSALKSQDRTEDYDDMILALVPPLQLEDDHPSNHLQSALEMGGGLPPKDYPILQPPKDYPTLEQHPNTAVATTVADSRFYSEDTNPAGDVYTVQEAKMNSSQSKVAGLSPSMVHSHKGGGKLSSKSLSNLHTTATSYYY